MPDILLDGDDYLALGADQFTNPQKLPNGKYVSGVNVTCRGGVVQTRPGSNTLITLPDGNLQGCTLFKPASGVVHLVAAVDGVIYVSPYPFIEYRVLPNIQFALNSQFVAWAVCLKSTDYNSEGTLYFVDNPYSVLMMQDGLTRAAYWDGSNSGHLDPTQSTTVSSGGEIVTEPGKDGTPVGLWMCWANNRLWVSRGNQVFASDIGNPMKFTETQYLNEARAFYLPELCTGIAPTTDLQGIVCFTAQTGTFLQSSIQDRTQWLSTKDFQKTILPDIGCVSPRSITSQYGLLWWYSSRGLLSQNDALRANISSRLDIQDNQMFGSKANMCFNTSGVASVSFENMLLVSVPNGDKFNTQTMVLDQAPVGDITVSVNAWASYWSGWRPVEWAKGVVNGEERLFFASKDYDGKNRIWELGSNSKTDNGVPITCSIVTRQHMFDNRDFKLFSYAEIELGNLYGEVSVQVAVAGNRGAWQPVATKEIVASVGQAYSDQSYSANDSLPRLGGSRPQSRVIKTIDSGDSTQCNAQCVETKLNGLIDKSFALMITWSGVAGINAYRIFADSWTNTYNGDCEIDEEQPNMLNEAGCGVKGLFSDTDPFTRYTSTYTYEQMNPETGLMVSYTDTAESYISQKDADRKARLSAIASVQAQLE